jgi:RNA polymerase sigma factor (sigma-70 family)
VRTRHASLPWEEGPCTSFEEAYRRHRRFVWLRILEQLPRDPSGVEDVHQQVFIRLDRRIRKDRGVPDPLRPVLLGLVKDEVRNHVRAAKRRRTDGAPDSELPTSKPGPEELLGHAEGGVELKRYVEAIFARMRTEEVELITLAHLRGLVPKDIADSLGVAVETLRVKLYRARVKFGELYRRHDGPRRRP